ncbi:hypothetical protein [Salinicola avicenniae]|uniref:hypothetical protein n=1 Tax=Salinicola avicenniae TaxID=2916836 RepID=UPI0020730252|nr:MULTISPECIES: hypothetical protein [unclassified Salinicola]
MVNPIKGALWLSAALTLAGCQSLAGSPSAPHGCGDIPSFADNVCLLDSWVAFGLEAQRGDDAWRRDTLAEASGPRPSQKAARAVVLSWDGPSEWRQASDLYKATLSSAPPRLQPLLQQWLNDLEERRQLHAQQDAGARRQGGSRDETQALKRENEALKQQLEEMSNKLDALTDIERTINSRD